MEWRTHSWQGDGLRVLADEEAATSDTAPRELISLADDEGNSVTVTVLGRHPRFKIGLDAEIVVSTPFVSGRLGGAIRLELGELGGRAEQARRR